MKDRRLAHRPQQSLCVRSGGNELIPLPSVVKLEELATSSSRNRFDRLARHCHQCYPAPGYSMGEAVTFFTQPRGARARRRSAKLPFDGEASEYLKSSQSMYWTLGGALLVVFPVLAAQFESFKALPFVIGDDRATRGGRCSRGHVAARDLAEHLQPGGHRDVDRPRCEDRGADRRVRQSATRPRRRVHGRASWKLPPRDCALVLHDEPAQRLRCHPTAAGCGCGDENRKPIGAVVLYGVMISDGADASSPSWRCTRS